MVVVVALLLDHENWIAYRIECINIMLRVANIAQLAKTQPVNSNLNASKMFDFGSNINANK